MSWVAVGVGLALAAGGAYVSHENTVDTNRRTDNERAKQILNQSLKQREADRKVNDQVTELESSTSADERAKRLDDYMQTLRANRGKLESGLTPNIGSDAFRKDAAGDAADVMQYAGDTAGLMARIDAANLQRQGEAFGYGNLATDLNLIGREAAGQNWLDELRVKRAARRNAGKDALAAFLGGAGSAVAGMGGAGSGGIADNGSAGYATYTPGGTTAFGYGAYGG